MKLYLKVYLVNIKKHIMAQMSYKVDFIIGVVSNVFEQVLMLFFLEAIFSIISQIDDFNYGQMLFIYGFSTISRSIHIIFFDNLWMFGSRYIRDGDLDRILTLPMNPLFLIVSERIQIQGIVTLIIGVLALLKSSLILKLSWTISSTLLLLFFILCAGFLFFSIQIGPMSCSFWIVDSFELTNNIFLLNIFTKYPIKIYPILIQILLTFIFPYAFTSYYPSVFLMRKSSFGIILPLVTIIIFLLNYSFFKKGLKKYTSVGS